MVNRIHPLADVQTKTIGSSSYVWQFSVILANAIIGENCNINCNCFIENDVVIGDNVTVKSGVQIWDGITVEDNVFIGPNVTFTNDLVPRSKRYPSIFLRTTLRKGCSVGANATIVGGVTIGEGAMVGAASLVSRNILPYTLWYGNPARHKGYVTEDAVILDLDLKDKKTGDQYYLDVFKPIKS
jgi:acetyltransferase-like isoleucine patch superfamily enzyme